LEAIHQSRRITSRVVNNTLSTSYQQLLADMSEASADPPVPPPNAPAADSTKAESSSAAAETAAATGDDVKMEEAKPVEETWEDLPEGVISVGGEALCFVLRVRLC
jgi:hypothetical protein